jgi:hypothetical protein
MAEARQCRWHVGAGDHGRAVRCLGRFAVRLRYWVSSKRMDLLFCDFQVVEELNDEADGMLGLRNEGGCGCIRREKNDRANMLRRLGANDCFAEQLTVSLP